MPALFQVSYLILVFLSLSFKRCSKSKIFFSHLEVFTNSRTPPSLIPSLTENILLALRPMLDSAALLNDRSSRLLHPSEAIAWKWFVTAWLTAFEKSSHEVCLRIFKAHIVSNSSVPQWTGSMPLTEILTGTLRASVGKQNTNNEENCKTHFKIIPLL